MKRASNLIIQIIEPENLRLAFWKAQKGKRFSRQVQAYRGDLGENLAILRSQIISGRVLVGDYHLFTIFDPKQREICAPAFREQVLHHALMNVCHPYFERKQIFDSYAGRKGKGTYAALNRAGYFTKKYSFFIKLDVRKFFGSIPHGLLKKQLTAMFKERQLLSLFGKIIDSYPNKAKRGLPIGNLTSQYFANHYLSGLDHFIKEDLSCKAYMRYMDDMIIWGNDKSRLLEIHLEILKYVHEKLQLELKPLILNKCQNGVPCLGYMVFPYYIRLSQRSKQRFIRKLRIVEANYASGNWPESYCQLKVLPLLAFTKHADAELFRQKVLLKLENKG